MDGEMRGLVKYAQKHIIQREIENGKAVLGAALFGGEHIGELDRTLRICTQISRRAHANGTCFHGGRGVRVQLATAFCYGFLGSLKPLMGTFWTSFR